MRFRALQEISRHRPGPVPDGKFAFLARAVDYMAVEHLKGKLVLDKKHRCLLVSR